MVSVCPVARRPLALASQKPMRAAKNKKPQLREQSRLLDILAGEEGLEPSHAGIKIQCLNQLGDSPRRCVLYSSFAMNLESSADECNRCSILAPARGRVVYEMSVMKAAVFAAAPSMVALMRATFSG